MPESGGSRSSQRDGFDETSEAIMEATYHALSEHGYPETSIARIASEFDRSKSLLYYHYDSKEDLLEDFFRYVCNRVEADLADWPKSDPHEQLLTLINRILPSDEEQFRFRQTYFEIRSQAPHNRSYHEHIKRTDDLVLQALTDVIERGVEAGRYKPVDPQKHAQLLFSSLIGLMERSATLDALTMIEQNPPVLIEQFETALLADTSEEGDI